MSETLSARQALPLRIHRDHVYIDAASFAARLGSVANIALLRDGDDLLIMPIFNAAAGGFLVKQVNARGDRAIHAADFFRLNGIDETNDQRFDAIWSDAWAGYMVVGFFSA